MDRAKARPDSTRRWKALRTGKVVLVDEGTAEAVLVPRERTGLCSAAARGATGSVRDHSRGSAREDNPRTGRGSEGTSDAPAFERMQGRNTVRGESKLFQRRQAQGSRGRIAARRCGVARETRSVHPERQEPCGCEAQASRPEVERSTGARVVGRLQKSGRSILPVFDEGSREANRVECGTARVGNPTPRRG